MIKFPEMLSNLFQFNQYSRNNQYYYKDHYYSSVQKTTFQKILEYLLEDTTYLDTCTPINFRDIPFSLPRKDVVKIFGKPSHSIVHEYNKIEYVTLHYKQKLGRYRTSFILYFINDSFFCGQYLFKEVYEEDIRNTLTLKYMGNIPLNPLQFPIKDAEGNVLVFSSDVVTLVTYISGSNDFMDYIRNEQNRYYTKIETERKEDLHILNKEL